MQMQDNLNKIISKLVARYPGCTAQEYARMILDQDSYGSYSLELLLHIQKTLIKEYREGRMPQIRIVKVDGKTRYFPADDLRSAMRTYFRLAARREINKLNEDKHIF